jgi:3-phosphoshikimate 1-carboxyvinyltransferase
MTRAVMGAFGVPVDGLAVAPSPYRPTAYAIEPDASAASYFVAAAAITGGRVRVPGLHRASLQGDVAFVDVLARMGAHVRWEADAVEVAGTGRLHGVDVDLGELSDTAPTLAVVAAFAEGDTRATGIGFIRRKESDRLAAAVAELRRAGVAAEEEPDGFVVHGRGPGGVHGARFATYDDHRMAMAFALVGLVVPGVEVADPGCVAKSFPGYFSALGQLR